jgi:hypothetical protein
MRDVRTRGVPACVLHLGFGGQDASMEAPGVEPGSVNGSNQRLSERSRTSTPPGRQTTLQPGRGQDLFMAGQRP